jgi:hypothetical protein
MRPGMHPHSDLGPGAARQQRLGRQDRRETRLNAPTRAVKHIPE